MNEILSETTSKQFLTKKMMDGVGLYIYQSYEKINDSLFFIELHIENQANQEYFYSSNIF